MVQNSEFRVDGSWWMAHGLGQPLSLWQCDLITLSARALSVSLSLSLSALSRHSFGTRSGTLTCPLSPQGYGDTSLVRNCFFLGPYSRAMPRALWCSYGGVLFLMSEHPCTVTAFHYLGFQPSALLSGRVRFRAKTRQLGAC